MDTLNWFAPLLGYGFSGIVCLAVLEKFVPLFPSYLLLMLLGMAIGDVHGLVNTIAAATAGSTLGAICWYSIGKFWGADRVVSIVRRYGRYLFVSPQFYDRMTNAYRRNHFWVTLSGQLIPAVRIYLALPAGVLRLHFPSFAAATSIGSLLWNATFLCLGYGIRASHYDPVKVGFWAAICLVCAEALIASSIAIYKRAYR
ncbi:MULTISPECIES: DedA family protein [unclassified Rhizobium]|uniref:DedA family protein n=1 Tax=unclassified Rhizobium TaxID=2613769 RepID=UPI002478B42C|nr:MULTISPECIES: DedA family protein [unclassified Rhizobium]MDH7801110.1 membrane protein DedA with SNARE-associated domain [Rhizobium sp. AN70]